MLNRRKFLFISILFLALSLFINFSAVAENKVEKKGEEIISFKKAVNWGLDNSYTIQKAEDDLNKIKLEIKKLESGSSWQLSFGSDLSYGDEINLEENINNNSDEKEVQGKFDLSLNKTHLSGISISSNINLAESEPFDFKNVEDKTSYDLNISSPIYPFIPTENKKKLLSLKDDLKNTKENLYRKKAEKKIDWLEKYFQIIRLEKEREVLKKNIELAKNNLNKTEKQVEINEAGKNDLLSSQYSLKEAEIALKKTEENLKQIKDNLYQNLNLKENWKIDFERDTEYINKISKEYVEKEFLSNSKLIKKVLNNNVELNSLKRQLAKVERELNWLKKEDNLGVIGNFSYQNNVQSQNRENWEVGLGFSLDIFDGGVHNLKVVDQNQKIESLKRNIKNNKKSLNLELSNMLKQVNIYRLEKESKSLKMKQAELKKNNVSKKFAENIISKDEYLQEINNYKKAQIEKMEAQDKYLIQKLRVLNFIGDSNKILN